MKRVSNKQHMPIYTTDLGCELHPKCLECPEPTGCALGRIHAKNKKQQRELDIRRAVREGAIPLDLAREYNLDVRTIQRIIKTAPSEVSHA
jgi:hypothetical protein